MISPLKRLSPGLVLRRDRRAAVLADIAAVVGGEDHRQRGVDLPLAGLLAVDEERRLAALAQAAAGVGELHAHLVLAGRDRLLGPDDEVLQAAPVVAVLELAVLGVQAPAADVRALGDDHAFGALLRHHDLGGDGVRLVLEVENAVLAQAAHAAEEHLGLALDQHRPAGGVRIDLLDHPVIDAAAPCSASPRSAKGAAVRAASSGSPWTGPSTGSSPWSCRRAPRRRRRSAGFGPMIQGV